MVPTALERTPSRGAVERAFRRINTRPRATVCRMEGEDVRRRFACLGRVGDRQVSATASRCGSIHTSEVPMPTRCSSLVPSGWWR